MKTDVDGTNSKHLLSHPTHHLCTVTYILKCWQGRTANISTLCQPTKVLASLVFVSICTSKSQSHVKYLWRSANCTPPNHSDRTEYYKCSFFDETGSVLMHPRQQLSYQASIARLLATLHKWQLHHLSHTTPIKRPATTQKIWHLIPICSRRIAKLGTTVKHLQLVCISQHPVKGSHIEEGHVLVSTVEPPERCRS